jgi:Zn-dependent M28 family amino/carboxypeptidase
MSNSRSRFGLLCSAALCVVAVAACAGGRPPPPSVDIDEDLFRSSVAMLASEAFEGRRPGTAGEDKTVAFVTAQFRRLGLKPGNGESFLQPVPMVETVASGQSLKVTSPGGSRVLAFGEDMVIWSKRAVADVEVRASPLVFAGYGIVAPEFGWDDYAGLDVRGKTVIVLANDPGHADGALFKGRSMTAYGRPDYKFQAAAGHGASAVLMIYDPEAAGVTWDALRGAAAAAQLELATPDPATKHAAIEGWIAASAARSILAGVGLDLAALSADAARAGFHGRNIGAGVDVSLQNAIRRFSSPNLVAVFPGQRRSHDYIVFSAHWDQLGRDAGRPDDGVYHGAVDDAVGVAGLLALAQSFKRTLPQPDRSIVFLAFTGEESGLLGSNYYVANPLFPLAQTVADINIDGLHVGGPTRDVSVIGFGQSELEGYLRDAAALQGRELHADVHPEAGTYFSSANFSFAQAGVPALYAIAGSDDAARGPAWGQAQIDEYYARRYRRTADVYSDDWDVRAMLEDLTLFYRVGLRLAQTRRFPNWLVGSEYRAARQRSRDSIID